MKMSARELEEWHKKLVREGKYDVHNFEEDNYYHDDDK